MILCDSHTHLDQYPTGEIPEVLQRADLAGVKLIIAAGTTLESSKECIRLANEYDSIFAGVGVHPMDVQDYLSDNICEELGTLASNNSKVRCISEIGLDYMAGAPEHRVQDQAFRAQIRIARKLNLPVIVHARESYDDVLRILREEGVREIGGVMHYFQGDKSTAYNAIDLGMFISLARTLLRLTELQDVVLDIPIENIVLETDAAPQPFKKYRHNWTEPRHVLEVAKKLAELKRVSLEEVSDKTTLNTRTLLNMMG